MPLRTKPLLPELFLAFLVPTASCLAQASLPLIGVGAPGGPPPHSATLVQQAQGTWSSGASFTVTMGAAPADTDVITMTVSMDKTISAAPTVSSISSTNTTWTFDGSRTTNNSSGFIDLEIWHGIVSGVGGTTLTINLSASTANFGAASGVEWSGTNGTLDVAVVTSAGTNNTCAPGSLTTTTNDLVVAACAANNTHTITSEIAPAPYVALTDASTIAKSGYNTPTTAGLQPAAHWTVTTGSGVAWCTVIAGYIVP